MKPGNVVRRIARGFPPIADRDAELRRLRREVTDLRSALEDRPDRPSFHRKHLEARRVNAALGRLGVKRPIMSVNGKPEGYAFAATYGVPVPTVLGRYPEPAAVPWAQLPDSVVVKPAQGTAARGVLLLERRDGGFVDLLDAKRGVRTAEELVGDLDALAARGRISRVVLVEELLRPPHTTDLTTVPDVKLYCFYGVVGLVLVAGRRRRGPAGLSFRYLDTSGRDLGHARPLQPHDPHLPDPLHLDTLLQHGRTLSAALPEPFVRLDFYEQQSSVVFGEVTPSPGGDQVFRPDVDEDLGALWEDAEARLRAERYTAGHGAPRFGSAHRGR